MGEGEFCYISLVDTDNNFQFILKDFAIGFVVIVMIVVAAMSLLNRASIGDYLKSFNSDPSANSSIEDTANLCAANMVYGTVARDVSLGYTRSVKGNNPQEKKLTYVAKYTLVGPEAITYELSYDLTSLATEQYNVQCDESGIAFLKPDSIILASLFNIDREDLDTFATFNFAPDTYWWLPHSFDDDAAQTWNNSFTLKGGLIPENYTVANSTTRYCYKLEVTSDSTYTGHDKVTIGETAYEGYKVSSNIRGILNVLMSKPQNAADCEKIAGGYDAAVEVSFTRDALYIPGMGLARQVITPKEVTGQGYLLPRGFTLATISDQLVSANGGN